MCVCICWVSFPGRLKDISVPNLRWSQVFCVHTGYGIAPAGVSRKVDSGHDGNSHPAMPRDKKEENISILI